MDEYIQIISVAILGLGAVGFVVCAARIAVWYRKQGGKTGPASRGGE